jgi:predicted nucleotidyltransferase
MPTFDASTNPERIPFVEVLVALCDLAQGRGVEIMLVGATARDIALAADGQDAALRATNDVDIAVVVADASAFELLVADLAPTPAGVAHKFLVNGVEVDILPIGGIEREDRTIVWPDGSTMNTLGFAESLDSALWLELPLGRRIRVASIPAQAAFKIFAWADRGHATDRDAVDLRVLLRSFSAGIRLDRIYADGNLAVFEDYEFDIRLAGAYWLGMDVQRELGRQVAQRCRDIVVAGQDQGRLPLAMRANAAEDQLLLAAFTTGLAGMPSVDRRRGAVGDVRHAGHGRQGDLDE